MSKSGFLCPECNSWDTEYVGMSDIECNTCGHIWDPGDEDDDHDNKLTCPRCGSSSLEIYGDGEFWCKECGLEGDIEDI